MNKYVKYLLLVAGSISFLFTGCYKCPACENPPLSVNFRIIDKNTSEDLLYTKRYSLDTIQIYSIENNLTHRIKIDSYIDTANKRVTLGSSDWIQKSLAGQKNYFLKLNDHDIDTILFNVTETLSNHDCCRAEHIKNLRLTVSNYPIPTLDFMGFIKNEFLYKFMTCPNRAILKPCLITFLLCLLWGFNKGLV